MECPSVYASEASLRDQCDIGRKRFVKQNPEALPPTTSIHQMDIWEEEPNLPMSDRGFLAWRFLVVLFILEGLIWAPPLSFGVFLNYSPYAEMSRALAASTGTLSTGIMYCFGAILSPFLDKHPRLVVWGPKLGVLMCAASFFSSSYATKAWHLFLSQGLMYGIGGSIAYYPGFVFLSEWWIERRGFAGAVMFAGGSFFGLVYPLIADWSLRRYGTPVTVRAIALSWLICAVPLLPFYHGRLPHASRVKRGVFKMSCYFERPITWILLISNIAQSLAFFVPLLYLPAFANTLGLGGGVYLGLFSGASIIGQMMLGTLSDKWDVSWLIAASCLASSASIFGLWGVCNGAVMLTSFSIIFGFVAGGFSCLWQRFVCMIDPMDSKSGNLIVIFPTSRGIANIVTGPITGALLSHAHSEKNGYRFLIYYCGSLMAISSLGSLVWFLKPGVKKA